MTFAEVIDTNAVDEETKVNREPKTGLKLKDGNVRISPPNYYYVTLILLYVSGIEDLHKALPKLFVPKFFSVIAAKASLVSLVPRVDCLQ